MALLIVGVTEDGAAVFSTPLDHGADPDTVVFDQGYQAVRPLEAGWYGDDLALRLLVRPLARRASAGPAAAADRCRPDHHRRRRAGHPAAGGGVRGGAVRRGPAGHRVLRPDGGAGPLGHARAAGWTTTSRRADCVRREVTEETAQQIVLGDLTKVQTGHWIGRNPGGMIEDFHAVRLVYRATCPDPTEPVVLDRGGSTASARWVDLDDWTGAGLDGQLDDDPDRAAARLAGDAR